MRNYTGSAQVTTEPAIEPITLGELREFLRLEESVETENDTLRDLIAEARVWCEEYTQRRFITQTVTQTLDFWPGQFVTRGALPDEGRISDYKSGPARYVELIEGPVQSITSVTLYDDVGGNATWNAANYRLASQNGGRARLALADGAAWPSATRRTDAIEILYDVGYGSSKTDVPPPIIRTIKSLAAHWYENREAYDAPRNVKDTLKPYRFVTL
jgi:hypothetical protein